MLVRIIPTILAAIGAALGLPEEAQDLAVWAGSAAGLGVVVGFAVDHLRRHVFTSLDGIAVVFLALGLGVAGGVGLGFAEYLSGSFVEWIGFGLAAGWTASAGKGWIDGILGKRQAS